MHTRTAFTLTELAAVLVLVVSLVAIAQPAHRAGELDRHGVGTLANLRMIGLSAEMYGIDNAGLIPAYSWHGGEEYLIAGNTKSTRAFNESHAWSLQNTDILRRGTGRTEGPDRIDTSASGFVGRMFSHLPLLDYLAAPVNSPMMAAPADRLLRQWQDNQFALHTFPYADGIGGLDSFYYTTDSNWTKKGKIQRWPFASSYLFTPASYARMDVPLVRPNVSSNHTYLMSTPDGSLGERPWASIAFPAQKVLAVERYDWLFAPRPAYFMYPNAHPGQLFYDGSAQRLRSGDATFGADPAFPDRDWTQCYLALDKRPWHLNRTSRCVFKGQIMWTKRGLRGLDYAVRFEERPTP